MNLGVIIWHEKYISTRKLLIHFELLHVILPNEVHLNEAYMLLMRYIILLPIVGWYMHS